jgi:hypothetical protein
LCFGKDEYVNYGRRKHGDATGVYNVNYGCHIYAGNRIGHLSVQ